MTNTQTQTERKSNYNGWTNYATWRIALEWFDDFNPNKHETDVYNLSKDLESYVEDSLGDMIIENSIVLDYALAFTSDVNWYEIASHLIEEQNN
jgi:hypothetical protein